MVSQEAASLLHGQVRGGDGQPGPESRRQGRGGVELPVRGRSIEPVVEVSPEELTLLPTKCIEDFLEHGIARPKVLTTSSRTRSRPPPRMVTVGEVTPSQPAIARTLSSSMPRFISNDTAASVSMSA